MAAVDEDGELDGARTAEVGQRIERGPDGAPGKQHVVDEDDDLGIDPARRDLGLLQRADAAQA